MFSFVLRHCAGFLATLILVSLIIAAVFSFLPGDPAALVAGIGASPEQLGALRESFGLHRNIFQRYLLWLQGVFSSQTTVSLQYGVPVYLLLRSRLVVTSSIALLAALLMALIALPLGLLAAYHRNSWLDSLVGNLTVLGLSVPNYLTSIIIIWICGVTFRLFTPGEFVPYTESVSGYVRCLFFPSLAVAIPNIAMLTKFVSSAVWDEMRAEYVTAARSKGAAGRRILFSHIARNAATPVLTAAGILIADILSGSIVVEQVFAVPGLGRLLIGGINARDFPLVISVTVYIAFIVVIVNFLFELFSRLCDPRTRLE